MSYSLASKVNIGIFIVGIYGISISYIQSRNILKYKQLLQYKNDIIDKLNNEINELHNVIDKLNDKNDVNDILNDNNTDTNTDTNTDNNINEMIDYNGLLYYFDK